MTTVDEHAIALYVALWGDETPDKENLATITAALLAVVEEHAKTIERLECELDDLAGAMSGSPVTSDAELVMRKSEWIDDWYVIERADGGRFSDSAVEGTATNMLGIATAIESRGHHDERRCAVDARGDYAMFWSPRNSRRHAEVPIARANALVEMIRKELGG